MNNHSYWLPLTTIRMVDVPSVKLEFEAEDGDFYLGGAEVVARAQKSREVNTFRVVKGKKTE